MASKDEEMLAASSSSALRHHLNDETVKKYGREQPDDYSKSCQHETTEALFDQLAAETADTKPRVEYLESLLSESSTLASSLLKDTEKATVVSGGGWQAAEALKTARSVAATLEMMVKEGGSSKEAHLKHVLARRERRIKELKAKLKQHVQLSEKVYSMQSGPKGMYHVSACSVVRAANAAVKRWEGAQCGDNPALLELGFTEKVAASGLGRTSTEGRGDATTLLPINNTTYLINDDPPQEGFICPGCEELTTLLKDTENRCLMLQHKVDECCVIHPSKQPPTQVALEKEMVCCPLSPREGGERKLHHGEGKRIHCIHDDNAMQGSDESISAAAPMMGKDSAMNGESTHLMGELLAQQRAHAAALEALQTMQIELSQEANMLREKNAEVEERVKVEIAATEEARSALKGTNAKCVELENKVIQANQRATSQLTADNIAFEEMSQAHRGVVRALKQSLIAVKAKAMINIAVFLQKRRYSAPDVEEKQKHPDCGLCHGSSLEKSEAAILRSVLAQSNTTLAELQTQLQLTKEETKVATAQLEVAMRRLSVLMPTCESSKSEGQLLPCEELEKEQHIHLQETSNKLAQNKCMLNSILQAAKLEILEAQCEEQCILLNSMEEDLMSARQQLELQNRLMDENVHSNDVNVIVPPSSSSATTTSSCNVSEEKKKKQRSITPATTTQSELSKLKELILHHLQATAAVAYPSSEDATAALSKEKELESLKASLATQKAEANRRGRALAALREVRAVNETEFVELKEKLKTCEGKLTQCLRGLGIKSTLVSQLKKQREELQIEVNTLRQSTLPWSEKQRSAITTSTKERDRLRSQMTVYRAKVKSLTKTVEASRVIEASTKAAEERAGQSEARSKELKREITRMRQDVMMWKKLTEECKMDAEQLRKEMDLLKNKQLESAAAPASSSLATSAATEVHPSSHANQQLIDSLISSLVEGVRSYARAGRWRRFGHSRPSDEIHSSLAASAMDTSITGVQQQQHGLDSNIVSSMLGVTLNEAVDMMSCTVADDDIDEFDWVSRAQFALLQWDGNMFWEVVREISSARQPDAGKDGVLAISEEDRRQLLSNLTREDVSTASLVDDEAVMVADWRKCLQCAKEILSS